MLSFWALAPFIKMKMDMTQSPEEYDVPDLASLDSPSTSRRGGSISISIPEITLSSLFSETGEFLLYLQECNLGIKEGASSERLGS